MAEPTLQKPTASFAADVQTGESPLTVVFTNTSTGVIAGYAWSFGDGSFSDDKNPTHVFASPGNYDVALSVFNEAGSAVARYRIDAVTPVTLTATDRAETIADLIPSIRAGLRRPSDAKLSYRDILDVLNDLLRGYSRDLHVSEQDHRTDESQCVLNYMGSGEYLLTVPGVPEVEAMQLKWAPQSEIAARPENTVWRECTIVPLDYYAERQQRDYAVCSFYAGMIVENGVKVKLNLSQEQVDDSVWRIRYRQPLLRLFSLSAKTPLPADLIPMLKLEAQLMCLPRIRDDSEAFYVWRKANEPLFAAGIADWRRRWAEFLDSNTEPDHAPKIPANDYRRHFRRRPTYTLERT